MSNPIPPSDSFWYPTIENTDFAFAWTEAAASPVSSMIYHNPLLGRCGHSLSTEDFEKRFGKIVDQGKAYIETQAKACMLCAKEVTVWTHNRSLERVTTIMNQTLRRHQQVAKKWESLLAEIVREGVKEQPEGGVGYGGDSADLVCSRRWGKLTEEERSTPKYPNCKRYAEFKYTIDTPEASLACIKVYGNEDGSIRMVLLSKQKSWLQDQLKQFGYTLDPSAENRTVKNGQGEPVPVGMFVATTPEQIAWACDFVMGNNDLEEQDIAFFQALGDNPERWRQVDSQYQDEMDWMDLSDLEDPFTPMCGHALSREALTDLCGPIDKESGVVDHMEVCPQAECGKLISTCVPDYVLKGAIPLGIEIFEAYKALAKRYRNLWKYHFTGRGIDPSVAAYVKARSNQLQVPESKKPTPDLGSPVRRRKIPLLGEMSYFENYRQWLPPTRRELREYPGIKRRVAYKGDPRCTPNAVTPYLRVTAYNDHTEWYVLSPQAEALGKHLEKYGYKLNPEQDVKPRETSQNGQQVSPGIFIGRTAEDIALIYDLIVENHCFPEGDKAFLKDLAQNPMDWRAVEKRHDHCVKQELWPFWLGVLEERERKKETEKAQAKAAKLGKA